MSFAQFYNNISNVPGLSIKATCMCGSVKPIPDLYFCSCNGCKGFVCTDCTQQVIDTYYCPTCLNSFFSSTAFQAKNRCQQCFRCPACPHTLTPVNKEGTHSLVCECCSWSSESLGVTAEDTQTLFALVNEHEADAEAVAEMGKLVKHYGQRNREALETKLKEVEDSSPVQREHSDHDMKAAVARIEKGLEEKREAMRQLPKEKVVNALRSAVLSHYEHDKVSSLPQRLQHQTDHTQPTGALYPIAERLQTKIGHRCRKCNQHVLKPKAGATKVTHDIASLAINIVPTLTVQSKLPAFKKGKTEQVVIFFKNTVDSEINLTLTQTPSPDEAANPDQTQLDESQRLSMADLGVVLAEADLGSDEGDQETEEVTFGEEDVLEGAAKCVSVPSTATVSLPTATVLMTPYDEIAEENELLAFSDDTKSVEDDKAVVACRHLSKVGVVVDVTPSEAEGNVQFSFVVNLEVVNAPPADEDEELLSFRSFAFQASFNLGPISA